MQIRAFVDRDGTLWEVWEAHPTFAERRLVSDRRETLRPNGTRRVAAEPDEVLRPPLEEGWLVFRSDRERRRQRPIPPDWGKMSDGDLRGLLNVARPSGPRSRMV